MIIWGTRTMNSNSGEGMFFCPRCNMKKSYVHYQVNRWFTLYFIPLIPLGSVGEFVECKGCAATWAPEVLRLAPPREVRDLHEHEAAGGGELERVLRRLMAMMVVADGKVDPREVDAMRTIFEEVTGEPLSEAQVKSEIRATDGDGDVVRYMKRAGLAMNLEGKRGAMRCALAVAKADGVVAPEERKLLLELAKALDLTGSQTEDILDAG